MVDRDKMASSIFKMSYKVFAENEKEVHFNGVWHMSLHLKVPGSLSNSHACSQGQMENNVFTSHN